MSEHLQRAKKILARINELASISEDQNCITRTYGTDAFIRARNRVEQWMKDAGLQTRIDNIGNVRGRLLSANAQARTFVIASHIDTVVNAGKFDGPLGVLMGLDIIEQLRSSRNALPFHIELIGFCDEEGCRFHTTYLGSKSVTGNFDSSLLNTRDTAGITLSEAIRKGGGDVNNLSKDAIARKDWLGYFEIHIEQGPVLYEKKIPVGIVKAIAGQCRVEAVFIGEAGHAGTVPMDMRRDALTAAAAFIYELERFAFERKSEVVATVGKLQLVNSASNVIPGQAILSVDLRSAEESMLSSSYSAIKVMAESICKKRNVDLQWNLIQQTKPIDCDAGLINTLHQSISEAGYEIVELVSGAGHDAVPVSEVSPVAMLFVRCFKGISHNPLENVEIEDMSAAIRVSDIFMQKLITHN